MLTPIAPPNYWPLRSTSSTSVTVTAGDGTIVCTNTNNATVAIPSAASLPNRIIVVKKGANNTATVTLDPDGSETIDGATSYVLYVVGDYVVIQSDGSNWRVIGGYLTPHSCLIIRAAQQTGIPHGTQTKILYDTVSEDGAALADISNSRVVIRRTSNYLVHCYAFILAGGDNLQFVDSYLRRNSAELVSKRTQCRTGVNLNTDALAIYRGPLSAGDVLEGTALHFAGIGTTKDTDNVTVCYLSVQELR